jgi:hypothetical protein
MGFSIVIDSTKYCCFTVTSMTGVWVGQAMVTACRFFCVLRCERKMLLS